MTDHEAQAAWRLFTLNWIPLALMGADAGALPGAHRIFDQAGKRAASGRARPRRSRRSCYFPYGAPRRGHLRSWPSSLGSAAQLVAHHRADDAAHLCRRGRRSAVAGRQSRRARPHARARLARLSRLLQRSSRRESAYLALGYAMIAWPMFGDPASCLALTRHYRPLAAIHARFRADADRDHRSSRRWCRRSAPTISSVFRPATMPTSLPAVISTSCVTSRWCATARCANSTLMQLVGIITFPSFHAAACRALSVGAVGDLVDAADRR